ncbi:MAG: metallophosphoesterase [Candidatus Euphemobacter frigidus]|nr:metallophosphoesterase [Candidatus Euphemobacter frigidus]MDP8275557.1 metallophosphoesterase [Candidatus Euphemobacter frigidus]
MSLKIFHTADIHLGMKFAGYPEVQSELTEARFVTLENLAKKANEESCDLFVVAGDLFDRTGVAKRDIVRAVQILNQFEGKLVLVLPGNHDYLSPGPGEPWATFKENAGDRVLLLEEKRVYPLEHFDLDANVYPAPCDKKHSGENYIGWIKDEPKDSSVTFHIGVAHGSLEGLSPDFDKQFYPMTRQELLDCDLDLWLLGHTHLPFPDKPGARDRIFYSATPEPDGFDCDHQGHAWIIEIDENKKLSSTLLTTGIYRFLHDEREIKNDGDLNRLEADYGIPGREKLLLKLKLKGRLSLEAYDRLPGIRETLHRNIFYLQWASGDLTEEITPAMVNRDFTEGSFPHRLLTSLSRDEREAEVLQVAYRLLKEARQ